MLLQVMNVVGAGSFALVGASAIVAGLDRWARRNGAPARPTGRHRRAAFLFSGERLVDATPAARRLLQAARGHGSDLARLTLRLAAGFGADLGERLAALPRTGRLRLASPNGVGTLEAEKDGGTLRVTLHPADANSSVADALALRTAEVELALLRGLAEDAPQPIWIVDGQGGLAWANRAYLALADRARAPLASATTPPGAAWPSAPLFPVPATLAEGAPHLERLSLTFADASDPSWHDVTSVRRGGSTLHFAVDVGGLVLAESARRQFVQTLAKTFAHLRTGLAIFDRERRLVLFNPALVDLTGLPIAFLSARPLVQSVLDRLRDAKILPEPRDYASWREAVAALEAAAEEGQYRETWTLPDGRTYRVTGRPHPDGALAFLFEDISDEVGLTRRFRADLDLSRAILDGLDVAIAAFSHDGRLVSANASYRRLWGPPEEATTSPSLGSELARWQAQCAPGPVWDDLRDGTGAAGAMWLEGAALLEGRSLDIRSLVLPGHGTVIMFRSTPVSPLAPLPSLPHSDATPTEPTSLGDFALL